MLFLAFAFFLFATTLSLVSTWFFATHHGPPPFWGLLWLVVIGLVLFAGARFTRKFSDPLGAVMGGLDSLTSADYSVRVEPSGPPPMRALGHALNTTAARLAAAEEQRRILVADIAHEVRTPLSVIRGNVEGILDGMYTADRTRLEGLLREVAVIARLVEDLGTLSSAEAGVLQIHRTPADLRALLLDVASSFMSTADAAHASITVADGPTTVATIDENRIREVLGNLVSNAIRHARGAPLTITLALRIALGSATVEIADSGPGIPEEELPRIFERYRKAPDSAGSGLGLAIARRLVEAHGGTISAASRPGAGTTISFSIPLQPPSTPE